MQINSSMMQMSSSMMQMSSGVMQMFGNMMPMLGKLFNILLFVGVVGSLFTVALWFFQKILRIALPIGAGLLGAVFYLWPIVFAQVHLISPEEALWIEAYQTASLIWAVGAVCFLGYYLLRSLFAFRAIAGYPACTNRRLTRIYCECAEALRMKRVPELLLSTSRDPACVVTLLRPRVILNEDMVLQLSDKEIQVVLCHELMHIKRRHHWVQALYDGVTILHWGNPLAWIAKREFAQACELDCDSWALKRLPDVTAKGYTATMLHLLEISSAPARAQFGRMGALGLMKQRFVNILKVPSSIQKGAMLFVVACCVALTIYFSVSLSLSMFYPYPAYSHGMTEYAENRSP